MNDEWELDIYDTKAWTEYAMFVVLVWIMGVGGEDVD